MQDRSNVCVQGLRRQAFCGVSGSMQIVQEEGEVGRGTCSCCGRSGSGVLGLCEELMVMVLTVGF
jgi:hypothetical protein